MASHNTGAASRSVTAYGPNTDPTIYTYGEFHQQSENLYDNAVAALADL
jgi:hypothetical protein